MASYVYEDGTGWVPLTASQLPASGVTPGTYGDATHVGQFDVNAAGDITGATNVPISGGGGGGTELDYKTQTADLTVTATTPGTAQTFLTGNPVTYDGSTRIKLELWSPNVGNSSGNAIIVELFDGSTDLGRLGASAGNSPYYGVAFLTPSAAAHTFTLKGWTNFSSGQISGNGGGIYLPAFYRITTA